MLAKDAHKEGLKRKIPLVGRGLPFNDVVCLVRSPEHGDLCGPDPLHPSLDEIAVKSVQISPHVFGDVLAQRAQLAFKASHFGRDVDRLNQGQLQVLPETKADTPKRRVCPGRAEVKLVPSLREQRLCEMEAVRVE